VNRSEFANGSGRGRRGGSIRTAFTLTT
jgi:hypothetical protein